MIRAATYNIRHGSLKGLGAIAEGLDSLDVDIVALQEVDRGVERSGGEEQARALGIALGMHAVFAPAMELQGGEYGVALLSRFPVISHSFHGLPSDFEPRVMLRATLDDGVEPPLQVVVTHLGLHPVERYQQVVEILRHLGRCERTLLLGDLNEGRTEAAFSLFRGWVDCLEEAGVAPLLTYPSDFPVIGIDHVLRTPDLPPSRRAHASRSLASDHLPVVVELG